MFIRKMGQARKYRAEAGEGGDGGSGAGSKIDLNSPEVMALVQRKIEEEVAGLKNKNSELLDKFKKAAETVKQFEGLDVEKMKNLQKQLEENEEMRLLSEGKTEEVVTRRVEAMKRDFDANLAARDGKISEYEQILKKKEDKLAELVIDGQLREAYVALDFEPSALDFVLMQGRNVFIMDEHGKAVPRDEHGSLIFGKDGKTPISAREYLEGLAEKKPFLRKPSKGSGASQNRSSSSDTSNMSSVGKIASGLKSMGVS